MEFHDIEIAKCEEILNRKWKMPNSFDATIGTPDPASESQSWIGRACARVGLRGVSIASANTLHCALELSKKSWLLAIQFPDREQPSYCIKRAINCFLGRL
jgi:hypothetical protein